jgi:hypothetical protein
MIYGDFNNCNENGFRMRFTVPPTVNQPIVPASLTPLTPVAEETDGSSSSSSGNDDDDDDDDENNSSSNDNDDDDSGDSKKEFRCAN